MSTLAATNLKHASSASNNIVLDTSGNVGIGISSPTQRLSVVNTSITGGGPASSGSAADPNAVARLQAGSVAFDIGVYAAGQMWLQPRSFTNYATNYDLVLQPNGGNVGIGTSSPGQKLAVVGSNNSFADTIYVNNTATGLGAWARIGLQAGSNYALIGNDNAGDLQIYNAANANMVFTTNATERMRISSSGNVGIGTSSPTYKLQVGNHNGYNDQFSVYNDGTFSTGGVNLFNYYNGTTNICGFKFASVSSTTGAILMYTNAGSGVVERARIDSSGNFMIGRNNTDFTNNSYAGALFLPTQGLTLSKTSSTNLGACLYMNRATVGDGNLVEFAENAVLEGSISVSGTTVSYNGGHLSRWSQLTSGQRDPALLKGTVLSNLDEMCVWLDEQGAPQPNEQLNKMKISDVEGDPNVAGVFVNWDNDDQTYTDDMNVAMTGDMIIRIAQGVVVQKGDLLMSAGDGTAKPQGDDIRRSKTVAKVTSNHVTCTYADGSYCVPCVLMAC